MRLLVIGNGWSPQQAGGLNRYVTNLSQALSDAGVEQQVLVLAPADEARNDVTTVASADENIGRRLAGFGRRFRQLRGQADVVVGHFALNVLPVLALLGRRRLVFHFHGPWAGESRSVNQRSWEARAKFLAEYVVYRRVDRFIVLSQAFRQVLVTTYGVPPEKVDVIAPGANLSRFRPDPAAQRTCRFVCVRRLVPRMGIDVLLRAWSTLSAGDQKLVIVGDGVERERLEQMARDLGVDDSVEFRGFVDDQELSDLYASSRASVIPTVELEGFGLVSLESLAAGLPVIASRSGGLIEALGGFSPEWMVEPGDAAQLAEALTRAITAPEELPSVDRCRQWARSFSWESAAARCLQVYAGTDR